MITKIIAVYPGRFQPFGKHHEQAFKWLQSEFGKENTYIATSNVVDPTKSPFSFEEKKTIISQYGLDKYLVQSKQPYKAEELLEKFDPKTTAVVFMVGKKDMQDDPRFAMKAKKDGSPSYFQPYLKHKKDLQGFDKHGYLIVAPHVSITIPGYGEMSGTNLRKALSAKLPREDKKKQFQAIFGWWDDKVGNMIFDKMENKKKSTIAEIMKRKNQTTNIQSEGKVFTKEWWAKMLDLDEGYMSAKVQKKHNAKIDKLKSFLDANVGRSFVYNFDEFPKTVYGVPVEDLQESLLKEGGAGGHMHHPFDIEWVKTGKDIIQVFKQSVEYLKNGPAAVKIDGVNASIRLITLDNKKQFVMDRGSNKPLDVKGITKSELNLRFGEGHGMIKVGGKVLDIFNDALPDITPALKKLGLWDNPNILFNLEYVAGSTNVLEYGKNFIAVHGLLEIQQVTPTKRATKEITYSEAAMQELLDNLAPTAQKYGFEVVGSIPTTLTGTPNLSSVLNKSYTITYDSPTKETKTLAQWLTKAKLPTGAVKTIDNKTISPLSKEVLIKLSDGIPLEEFIADPKDYQSVIDGYVIYLATMKLGDAILEKLTSPLGPVSEHEGIVIRDTRISKDPFKITGKFILGGLASSFRK